MAVPFKVDIATGGAFECTSPSPKVYVLSFSSPPDNRLTSAFIEAWVLSLDIIEQKLPRGVLITTSAIPKFYSNGLNLEHVVDTPGFFPNILYPLFRKLLAYPMPTIALLNGHAFAGGFMAAMYHDYRIMNPSKGYLCLNEVLFGAVMTSPMVSVFRQKLANPQVFRDLILEAKRVGGAEALQTGIVDALGALPEVLDFVKARNLTTKGETGVYGQLKEEMWRETLQILRSDDANVAWRDGLETEQEAAKERALESIRQWESKRSKANL